MEKAWRRRIFFCKGKVLIRYRGKAEKSKEETGSFARGVGEFVLAKIVLDPSRLGSRARVGKV